MRRHWPERHGAPTRTGVSPRRRAAAVLGVLGLVLSGGLGNLAPAAAVPLDGRSPMYRLAAVQVADGQSVVVRWNPCREITYRVNVAAVPLADRAAVVVEIRRAADRLAAATGLRLSYRGITFAVPRKATVATQQPEIVIAVITPSATDFGIGHGVVGFGGYRYWQWSASAGGSAAGAAIGRGWVVLDVTAFSGMRPGFGAGTTQGNVVLHELGHVVGLGHVPDPTQLMADTLTETSPDGYATGDRTALRLVGREAGCLAVPAGLLPDPR